MVMAQFTAPVRLRCGRGRVAESKRTEDNKAARRSLTRNQSRAFCRPDNAGGGNGGAKTDTSDSLTPSATIRGSVLWARYTPNDLSPVTDAAHSHRHPQDGHGSKAGTGCCIGSLRMALAARRRRLADNTYKSILFQDCCNSSPQGIFGLI
jgi:hypothetical protein